ncbi:hypothetical protein [Rickettsiella endosymbiont of Rhagonycha lignosa]|uniref:hypothetical protein n=1 Tax=Rickettsiella endosymbiont of Rhagonycha lignosa TaxID=3077937 RepID=UPI00313C7A93
MISYKESIISNLKSKYDLRLKKSTWINDLQQALFNFTELGSFQAWGKEWISKVVNQLEFLAKLELQINHLNNNQINLTVATAEIEASLIEYDELEAKNKVSLLEHIHRICCIVL